MVCFEGDWFVMVLMGWRLCMVVEESRGGWFIESRDGSIVCLKSGDG